MSPVTLWTVSVDAWMVQALILESFILLKVHFVVCGEGNVVIFMAWLNYGSSQSEACIPQLFRPIGSLYLHNCQATGTGDWELRTGIGDWDWGLGSGTGIGNWDGEWGMGNGKMGMGNREYPQSQEMTV